jgi:hypothetical protein
MNRRMTGTFVLMAVATAQIAFSAVRTDQHWELKGDLSEACSCSVPCTCNFGQGPSPHHFCWAMFALDIEHGRYGDVNLDGLHLVGAHADKSVVWYIDQSATPAEFDALKVISREIGYRNHLPQFVERARITQQVTAKGNFVEVAGRGGFRATYLIGHDGKNPIVVENPNSWNIPRSIKGETAYLRYSDDHGNMLDFKNTNSNEGKFDWTDKTSNYF